MFGYYRISIDKKKLATTSIRTHPHELFTF